MGVEVHDIVAEDVLPIDIVFSSILPHCFWIHRVCTDGEHVFIIT